MNHSFTCSFLLFLQSLIHPLAELLTHPLVDSVMSNTYICLRSQSFHWFNLAVIVKQNTCWRRWYHDISPARFPTNLGVLLKCPEPGLSSCGLPAASGMWTVMWGLVSFSHVSVWLFVVVISGWVQIDCVEQCLARSYRKIKKPIYLLSLFLQ